VLNALYDRPLLLAPGLRNLTKRQCIREHRDTLAKLGRDNVFGQVLLARICRSSDSSVCMVYEGELYRGEWAGDLVDCVEFQDFENDLSGMSDDHDKEQRSWAWGLLVDSYEVELSTRRHVICS
jgi:hypothetical protein